MGIVTASNKTYTCDRCAAAKDYTGDQCSAGVPSQDYAVEVIDGVTIVMCNDCYELFGDIRAQRESLIDNFLTNITT